MYCTANHSQFTEKYANHCGTLLRCNLQIYRSIKVNDLDLKIRSHVTYIEGLNNAERQQLAQMLVRAYVDGLNAAASIRPPQQPCKQTGLMS